MASKEWYKDWLCSPYYDLLNNRGNEQRETIEFVKRLIQYLHPGPGSYMVDTACGKGDYSKVLANMEFDVTGIDLSEAHISEAQKFETQNLHFFQHDIRLPFYINYFDYAFNFPNGFGYFETQREHDDAIRTIVQSLKSNGIFVVDYLNVHYTEFNLVKNEELKVGNVLFRIIRWDDENRFYKKIEIKEPGHDEIKTYAEKFVKFSFGDFTDMLAYQNAQVQEVFGNYNLEEYDVRKSPRMIIIARKIHK